VESAELLPTHVATGRSPITAVDQSMAVTRYVVPQIDKIGLESTVIRLETSFPVTAGAVSRMRMQLNAEISLGTLFSLGGERQKQ